ncbi:MAG: hypothetical protein PUP91_36395 [Rhizonema sp. PD37]|nr:hypothetical protein [Rhizonema sp. PD37]
MTINKQKSTIKTVAFTPRREWIIISNNGRKFDWSTGFPQDIVTEFKNIYSSDTVASTTSITFTLKAEKAKGIADCFNNLVHF